MFAPRNPLTGNPFDDLVCTRRQALQIGGGGLALLAAQARAKPVGTAPPTPRARSVILLFQFGGPSHLDLFDLKPQAPDHIRGPYRPIDTCVAGLQIGERLPRLAQVMNKVTLVRSMHHEMTTHNAASYYALTGHAPPVDDLRLRESPELAPAYGSLVDRLAPAPPQLPTFVALPHTIRDGEITPGQRASYLGATHDPLVVLSDPNAPHFRLPELSLPRSITPERLANRQQMQQLINEQARLFEISATARALDEHYRRATDLLENPQVRTAFDLSAEPAAVRERYGRTTYGQSCLVARRLVEAGVRFVNVYYAASIGGQSMTSGGWDTHGFNQTRMFPIIEALHLPLADQTLPTLLSDLDERGLLDQTAVVWLGEFGRTPRINDAASRDHWPHCYSVVLAGGGFRRGYVHGASDKHGAHPSDHPLRPEDLAATLLHLLGIVPATMVHDRFGRPTPAASGRVVHDLLA